MSKRDDDKGPKLSIGQKFTRLNLVTCGVAILIACTALAVFDLTSFSRDLNRALIQTADTLGARATVALYFRNAESARVILSLLSSQPHTVKASI